ncbi:ABC transporter ATP-binding protein [Lolliginicoccus suaedae]|uniref:ABC transporter ATP-binding protein n=1 Tax=Lolliginicoccus suaedae TaxID=2605429 RepID=UPI0011EBD3AF|nr:ATP-binding cassette domain-containing protein [Lolliginicoccus suaedae]
MTTSSLRVPHVAVDHHGTMLADVEDLQLDPGISTTIVGESGSGKSILAHALMGTLPRSLTVSGSLFLDGKPFDLASREPRHLWAKRLALLPQEPMLALDPTMRIINQVAEGARGFRTSPTTALGQARRALDGLGLTDAARSYPHTLSGGMAQRVAFAAASIGGADVLIVDEPTKGLDAAAVDHLGDLLEAHLARGGMLLAITHDLRFARRLGGQVLVMKDATVVEQGPVEQVLSAASHAYTQQLVAAEPSRWRYPWQGSGPHALGQELVRADALSKAYGSNRLFEDLSVHVGQGDRIALTGPSGAGKTTLGNVLIGLASADTGQIEWSAEARGTGRQKLYQDPALAFPRRVPLRLAMHDVCRRHSIDLGRLDDLLEQVGLQAGLLDRLASQVSGGELQRLAIVRAMLVEPALILADEATSRLDLISQERTIDCLMRGIDHTGAALLLITHDTDLAAAIARETIDLAGGGSPAREPAPASAMAAR